MKKILSITLFTLLLTANQNILEDLNTTTEDTNITQSEDVNLSALSEEELIAQFMKADDKIKKIRNRKKEARAKTEAIIKLGKTVDELSEQLGMEE